jgi:peptidyl-prolyl cis-trans isomerase SurA
MNMNYRNFLRALLAVSVFVPGIAGHSQAKQDAVLMTINNKPVYVSEFTRILNKNKNTLTGQKPSLKESLDMFINFKLKVMEAEAQGMDTTAAFKKELANNREQLAKPYLMDQEVTDELIKEAYDRSKYEVRASHILIGVKPDAPAGDTLLAYKKAMAVRDRLLAGEKFEDVAKEVSDDISAKTNGGDLGYIPVLTVVYPFETAIFNMKIGELSMPVRTQFGYHIIKVTDKKPARGKIKVATIWKAFNYTTTDEEKAKAKEDIQNIYLQLKQGADFNDLARKYSDDRNMAVRGDAGFWIGPNQKEPAFDQAAYSLKNPGDISEPVETSLGWFIIRLLEKKAPDTWDEAKTTLATQIARDSRSQKSENVVIAKLKKEYHFKVDTPNLVEFYRLVDPSIFEAKWNGNEALAKTGVLFTLGDMTVKQSDFAKYLILGMRKGTQRTIAEFVDDKFNSFANQKILDYEKTQLEKKYPEFRDLYNEFRDGNLLFEITDKMVWSKASKDTVGLEKFFETNQSKYMWPERLNAVIVFGKGSNNLDKMMEEIRSSLQKKCKEGCDGTTVQGICNDVTGKFSGNSFDIEDKLYAKGDNWLTDQVKWKPGASDIITEPDTKVIVWINGVVSSRPKKLDDVRGQVTADYQDYLEKEWVKALRAKYPVKINEDVLSRIKI